MRSIPLRLKLVVALVLPMMIVAVLVGERVNTATNDRRVAAAQETEAIQLSGVASFADAIAAEAVAINDVSTTPERLAELRIATDDAIDELRTPEFGLDPAVLQALRTRYAELTSFRATLGDDPKQTNVLYQQEIYRADTPQFANGDPAETPGTVSYSLNQLNRLPGDVIEEFEFDADALVDVNTTRSLSDYGLVQRFRADQSRELSAMLRLSSTPTILIDEQLIDEVATSIQRSEDSLRLIEEFGTPDLAERVESLQGSLPAGEYRNLRNAADSATPGVQPLEDTEAVNEIGAVVTEQYAGLADDVVDNLRREADGVVYDATRSLILSVLVGVWVIVLTAMLLRFLYRAIKSPLDRLTEQSRQIASVELPQVVAAMRRGDLDEVPEIEELVAESDDEIGELVHAFNDMHRTAVGLAAEQAGSRRIVADMFVNLGRRNQRLINRLLKRLTLLEQDERDPDKLAGLYEIDHVATRMRRNAESLLVLAGAGQSRRWDHPVDVYDIARGALSEVEGYERVLIDTVDDLEIHGDVVADLTHLLAELVENALAFSPPETAVELVASKDADGYVVVVADRGVGMSETQLDQANERIRSAAHDTETPSEFLGHYVIGRLAARHGVTVELAHGESSGTVATVRLPTGAVVPPAQELVDEFTHATSGDAAPIEPPAPAPVAAAPAPPPESANTIGEQPTRVPNTAIPTSIPSGPAAVLADTADTGAGVPSAQIPLSPPPAPPSTITPTNPPSFIAPSDEQRPAPGIDPLLASLSAPVVPPEASPERAPEPTPDATPEPAARRASSLADLAVAPDVPAAPAPVPARPDAATAVPVTAAVSEPASAPPAAPAAGAPSPAAPSTSTSTPSDDLARAQSSANEAVGAALSVFGAARRTPGANLPNTSLVASLSGVMSLDSPGSGTNESQPAASPVRTPDATDPDEIRFQLAGFQSGTRRADRED